MATTNQSQNVGNQRARDERDRFVAFAFASADILIELDPEGKVVFVDGATFGLLGLRPEQMLHHSFHEWVAPEEKEDIANLIRQPRALKRLDRLKIHLSHQKTGKMVGFALSGYQIPYLNGHIFLTLGFIRRDVETTEIGMRDLTSGLYKQEAFATKAAELFLEAAKESKHLHVTMLDVDDLPALMLRYEANEADEMMESIFRFLQEQSYTGDAVGIAGEHGFVILHDDSHSTESIANGVRSLYLEHEGKQADIASGSLALDAPHISEKDCARALQYTINRFAESHGEAFDIASLGEGYQTMLAETVKRISVFHKTVDESRFSIALQPIVDMRTKQPHHHEVLARIEDGETFHNPFDFISFGEEAGVIGDFDLAMCERTLALLEDAANNGKYPLVAVNLSGYSISSSLFCDTLSALLDMHMDIRRQVMFEITESARIADLPRANHFVQKLRKQGNLFCLDDFGVGESSFEYIRHLEVDYIKIDGSYVTESLETQRGKHLLRAMIGMCHDLQIATIAEHVEDEKVAQFLTSCGVTFGQGYYFGRPSTDLLAFIQHSKNVPLPKPGPQTLKKAEHTKGNWTDNLLGNLS